METIGNIVVGKPDIEPSAPSHTMGVREGNRGHRVLSEPGIVRVSRFMASATVHRSTGINAKAHQPIDPRMPIITPA